jgi:hypothetical protein
VQLFITTPLPVDSLENGNKVSIGYVAHVEAISFLNSAPDFLLGLISSKVPKVGLIAYQATASVHVEDSFKEVSRNFFVQANFFGRGKLNLQLSLFEQSLKVPTWIFLSHWF